MKHSSYYCHRIGIPIPISLELFPFRPLPEGAFGTPGDLAIRHREIFTREQNNFDFYLVQEDDVSFDSASLQYFVTAYQELKDSSENFYPGFFGCEELGGEFYPDFRMKLGTVMTISGNPYYVRPQSRGDGSYG
jgi:hypothetical protein